MDGSRERSDVSKSAEKETPLPWQFQLKSIEPQGDDKAMFTYRALDLKTRADVSFVIAIEATPTNLDNAHRRARFTLRSLINDMHQSAVRDLPESPA